MQWHKMNIETIVSGKTADDISYLKLFLIDYKKEFNVEVVNPSCSRCLNNYLDSFKKKYNKMENTSNYILKKKREGLQLSFGSSIFVTNKNLTDEYAKKLIERFSKKEGFTLDYLFDKYPKEEIKKEIETVTETTEQPQVKRTRKKRK